MSECKVKPLKLAALAVDDLTAGQNVFRRWEFNYSALEKFRSPEPSSMNRNNEIKERGVWIRFILPRSLRIKKEEMQDYPYIPNRFLITRIDRNTGKSRAWVLESDCPLSNYMNAAEQQKALGASSMFLISEAQKNIWSQSADPYRKNAQLNESEASGYYVNLGVAFEAEKWQERDKSPLFLTACAPGNTMFSAYIGHNSNILSFRDDLEDLSQGELDYSVVGWYSDLQMPDIYTGQIYGVHWNKKGVPVTPNQDIYQDELTKTVQEQKLNVAIGQSTEEAFRSYLNRRFSTDKIISKDKTMELDSLLAALYYNSLDYKTSPAGLNRLGNMIHDNKFDAKSGGTKYMILSRDEKPAELSAAELELIEGLNRFEKELELLTSLRGRLFEMWWKKGYLKTLRHPANPRKPEDFDTFFDVSKKDSLISKVISKMNEVYELYRHLPKEGEDLEQYGKSHGVQEAHILKAVPGPRYWREGNPVVLINGTKPAEDLDMEEKAEKGRGLDELLHCTSGELSSWPQLSDEIPQGVRAAAEEAAILLCEARGQKPDTKGIRPAEEPVPWNQPWKPIFMEWMVEYQPISVDSFYFNGVDYEFNGNEIKNQAPWQFGGISYLDAHHKSVFAEKISKLAGQQENGMGQGAAEQIAQWDMLSQELVNLKDEMGQRDYRTFRRPLGEKAGTSEQTLDEILGFAGDDEEFWQAAGGRIENAPLINGDIYPPFTPFQSGKGKITDLFLYDAFGRVMPLILSGQEKGLFSDNNFPLIRPEYMATGGAQSGTEIENRNEFWMKPRLLQYGRLHFQFLRSKDRNMVHGYVIVNHLNRSLLLYAPDGSLEGELLGIYTAPNKRAVYFRPAGADKAQTVGALQEKYPTLGAVAQAQMNGTPEAFWKFLDTIDRTLWTMEQFQADSDENAAASFGRPLALLNVESFIELDGLPMQEAGWEGGFQPEEAALSNRKFPVRIGDQSIRSDGVVGYYAEEKYDLFYSVAAPEGEVQSIHQIGPLGAANGTYAEVGYGKEKAAHMTILADPRGSIHAYTGIFPVKEVKVLQEEITQPLCRMEVQFQAGPFVTRLVPDEEPGGEISATMPLFAHNHGEWKYEEQEKEYGLISQDDWGQQEEKGADVREGILRYRQKDEEK